ncbi:MAG TPA: NAD-dependent epimerase/dehydratase family protein [Mesorhizobium sp.]|uniref:NAD-dependent epimerase/dehydratase family protein n=1 Tax=Mesorhizobium sp. TaxID=1871066 RepID=UPI002DDDA9B2|nr:NAD-dependent epimerase/dehydratase family protein [Mesorhizobium sp.]HEV2503131.1 NAD-dependent epimerase/dehydratase family protein [Mesorhizobium sp.]
MKILVTGGTGFVGKPIVERLIQQGHHVVSPRRTTYGDGSLGEVVLVGEINANTDWSAALRGCEAVIHLAAQLPARSVPDEVFFGTNDRGTARLTEQATAAGVRLFIYVSSIGAVVGHSAQSPVTDDVATIGPTIYGRSKLNAEAHVSDFAAGERCGISLRPPILYGSGARGNWQLMLRLAASGLPLPFASVNNRRHMMAAGNLVDAICHLIARNPPAAASGAYAVADTEALGLAQILRLLRGEMGLSSRLFPVPVGFLRAGFRMIGRHGISDSLLESLEINSQRFCATFDWRPVIGAEAAMRQSAQDFIGRKHLSR